MKRTQTIVTCAALAALVFTASANAANKSDKAAKVTPEAKQVEFFQALKDGDIGVKFIPKDANEANVLIENKAKKPLNIKLPDAFAGVPVLAQMGMGGMGGMGGGGMGGGGNQGMGGGMGGMGGGGMGGMGGGGMGGGGGGGGFFNVAPDKIGKLKVPTVCLEHGKHDPNPRIAYEIKPIETFNKDPKVIELCKMIGRGEVPTNIAQAAAWHLASNVSWAELATKDRIRLRNGYSEKYFSPQEIVIAMGVVREAVRRADVVSPGSTESDPGKANSLSQN